MSLEAKRNLAMGTVITVAIGAVVGAVWAGAYVAESVPRDSDDSLGIQNVLAGFAAAAGVLIPISAVLFLLVRQMDSETRHALVRLGAWIMFVPAAVWTALLAMLAAGSGNSDDLTIVNVLPEWAIVAVPLFVASAVLFGIAYRLRR
jgi:cytochrome bd-type quinol oxidase subunit 2